MSRGERIQVGSQKVGAQTGTGTQAHVRPQVSTTEFRNILFNLVN